MLTPADGGLFQPHQGPLVDSPSDTTSTTTSAEWDAAAERDKAEQGEGEREREKDRARGLGDFGASVGRLRATGNEHFREGRYDEALRCYNAAVSRLRAVVPHPEAYQHSCQLSATTAAAATATDSSDCACGGDVGAVAVGVGVGDSTESRAQTGNDSRSESPRTGCPTPPPPATSTAERVSDGEMEMESEGTSAEHEPVVEYGAISQASVSVLLCNAAACCIQLGDPTKAALYAGRAIVYDESNIKAWYRRACAYEQLGKYTEAENDLMHILTEEPHNLAAQAKLRQLQEQFHQREATLCRNMLCIPEPTPTLTTANQSDNQCDNLVGHSIFDDE